MFKHRRDRADRWLVARDHRDQSFDVIGGEVRGRSVVHEFAADEREAHLGRAVELTIGHANGEGGCNEAVVPITLADSTRHGGLNRVHLFLDSQVALAITEVAEHGPHRTVDLGDVLAQEIGSTNTLHVTSRVRERHTGRTAYVHSRRGISDFSHSESVPTL